jgi:excisionase family DNA binding protein
VHQDVSKAEAATSKLLLTAREAARALAVSERMLWGITKRGDLKCVRFGRAVRYDPRDLQQLIESSKK